MARLPEPTLGLWWISPTPMEGESPASRVCRVCDECHLEVHPVPDSHVTSAWCPPGWTRKGARTIWCPSCATAEAELAAIERANYLAHFDSYAPDSVEEILFG